MSKHAGLLIMIVASTCLAFSAWAQTFQSPAHDHLPYRLAKADLPGETPIIRMFFSFSCPFCYQSHDGLMRWGGSLPKGLRFAPTPVITMERASGLGAAYFYAVQRVAPSQLQVFTTTAYEEIQRNGGDAATERTYQRAARKAGIPIDALARAARSKDVAEAMRQAAFYTTAYDLDATPSVVAGGRYIVSPETTQGVNGNFYELLNAVTSKHIIESGQKKD